MKIVIDNKIPFIKGRLEPFYETTYLNPPDFTPEIVRDAEALIVRTRTRCDEFLLKDSKVKRIATATIGTDHIDLEWCKRNKIDVFSAAGCNAPAVADYVWATLLNSGFEPIGKRLGVVGYGHIGTIVARIGEMLGCRVMVCDPPKQEAGDCKVDYQPLETLLRECDAVTFHVPLTYEGPYPTYHLVSASQLDMMKPGAWIVNASRGGVVDEKALIEAIEKKGLKAIVDVWENEPQINRKLLNKAVIATPHIAGYSLEGKQRATDMVCNYLSPEDSMQTPIQDTPQLQNPTPLNSSGEEEGSEVTLSKEVLKNRLEEVIRKLSEDSRCLIENPEMFEKFRENYDYRHEVLCSL